MDDQNNNIDELALTEFIKKGETITLSLSDYSTDSPPYGRARGNCEVRYDMNLHESWKEWPRWNMFCCDLFQIYRGEFQVWSGYNYTGRTEIIQAGNRASWPNQIRSWKRIKD